MPGQRTIAVLRRAVAAESARTARRTARPLVVDVAESRGGFCRLGAVGRNVWEERVLNVDLTNRKELRLVLEPTTCDGASYISREGGQPPELVVEYEP